MLALAVISSLLVKPRKVAEAGPRTN